MYTIIEDSSPFYIRFTHDRMKEIIDVCQEELKNNFFIKGFSHRILRKEASDKILSLEPFTKTLMLNPHRVSLFVTKPGFYYRAHKDGAENRMSINFTVQILDDKCVTNWYDDSVSSYPLDTLGGNSREAIGFDKSKHVPIKTMTAKPNECILFNTDIWHDFDNSQSSNLRAILTLRSIHPGKFYFDDVKKLLLENV